MSGVVAWKKKRTRAGSHDLQAKACLLARQPYRPGPPDAGGLSARMRASRGGAQRADRVSNRIRIVYFQIQACGWLCSPEVAQASDLAVEGEGATVLSLQIVKQILHR